MEREQKMTYLDNIDSYSLFDGKQYNSGATAITNSTLYSQPGCQASSIFIDLNRPEIGLAVEGSAGGFSWRQPVSASTLAEVEL